MRSPVADMPLPSDPEEFFKQFSTPDPRYSPVPLWWWSGERLEIEKLRWQMDRMLEMGIRNVCIINLAPNGIFFGSAPDDPAFLSEEWWTLFGQVCAYAKVIGLFIWFYDQIGFSGASYQAELAAIHPDFLAQQLRSEHVEGVGHLAIDCPSLGTAIAAYFLPSSGGTPHYVELIDSRASVNVSEPSRLRLVYTVRQGYDYYSSAACNKLLDTVHREFARRLPQFLGSTVVGSFQDELPDLPTWGDVFTPEFQGSIHHLFEEGDDQSPLTRLRYHRLRARLAEQAFLKPFFHWHEENGLQCGFDQQSPAREARVSGTVAKYADYLQTHRWYSIPGSDLHGNGKLHSSIAFLYDRPRVWLEGFHSTGWGGTLADTFDWMLPYLQAGVTLFNPHAIYYSTRKGWWEWAPPSTCWRQPYARHHKHFSELIARICKLFAQGTHQATIGVVFLSSTVQAALGAETAFDGVGHVDQTFHQVIRSMRWHQAQTGVLDQAAIDFHLLDEPSIAAATVSRNQLAIKTVAFQTIVLPAVSVMDDAAVDQLIHFAACGGTLVSMGDKPLITPSGRVIDVRRDLNARVIQSAAELRSALADVRCTIKSPIPFLHRIVGKLHLLLIPAVAGMATTVNWPAWAEPMMQTTIDGSRYERSIDLKLPTEAAAVWRFDPTNGAISAIANNGRLDFGGAPFAILAWSDADPLLEGQSVGGAGHSLVLSTDWQARYEPTLPTEVADNYDRRRPELRWPHTAEFRW